MKIQSARHNNALEYALKKIRESEIFPYVKDVILYGSCARGDEKFSSDVDLFRVLHPSYDPKNKKMRTAIRLLKSDVMTDNLKDPEVDLKIVVGDEWKDNKMCYYNNVRKDGRTVWH